MIVIHLELVGVQIADSSRFRSGCNQSEQIGAAVSECSSRAGMYVDWLRVENRMNFIKLPIYVANSKQDSLS